jgi:pyruvate,water dikinase
VRVVRSPDQLTAVKRGDVLVARLSEPAWVPAFSRIAGIITEVGGWLSHAAIVAREYKIPAIVGAAGALTALKTGDKVRMRPNGLIERVPTNGRRRDGPSGTASRELRPVGERVREPQARPSGDRRA